jgi:small GTP-binding protein
MSGKEGTKPITGSPRPGAFKVVIVGNSGVGKTQLINRLIGQSFTGEYKPTVGAEIYYGKIGTKMVDYWDTAGIKSFSSLRDGYYIGAQLVLLCFSRDDTESYKSIPCLYRDITRVCDDVSMILLQTKKDLKGIYAKQITFHRKKDLTLISTSSKDNYGIKGVLEDIHSKM